MQNCANCGHQNRPGVVYCENCGASLLGEKPLSTKSITESEEEKARLGVDSSVLTDVKVQGVSEFTLGDTLRLDIEGSPEPIIFKPKPETIFGRRDPATGAMPDVDLTPFAGYRMGVSRRHAAIRQGEEQSLNIWDLGSSNGTFLNGQKLSAHRPYRLHDGDELRLGQMMVRIHFQPGLEVVATAKPTDTSAVQQLGSISEAVQLADEEPAPTTSDISEAGAEVAAQAEAEAPAAQPAAPESKPEAEPIAEAKAQVEPKAQAEAKPEAEAKVQAEPETKTEQPASAPAQPAATAAKSAEKADAKPETAKPKTTEKPDESGQEKPKETSAQDESAAPTTSVQPSRTTSDAVQSAAKPPMTKPVESKPKPPDQKPEPPITDDFKIKKTPDDTPEKTDEASKPKPETVDKNGEKPGEKPDKASDEKPDKPEQTNSQPESNEKKRD
jgi:hypothetical protein